MKTQKTIRALSALILTVFGLLTLFLSSSIIFDLFDIRAKQGNYVLFIVWANLVCSLLYLFSAYGFLKIKSWTKSLLVLALIILIISFISLGVHINKGGIYETRTLAAMTFRISLTLAFTVIAYFTIKKGGIQELKR